MTRKDFNWRKLASDIPVPSYDRKYETVSLCGRDFEDPFAWLLGGSGRALRSKLRTESEYADLVLRRLRPFQSDLFKEMTSRLDTSEESVPTRFGGYDYYTRHPPALEFSIYCRRRIDGGSAEEVVLDLNREGEGHRFIGVQALKVSPDGNFVAYSLDFVGDEEYELRIKDLRSGEVLRERIAGVWGVEWSEDPRVLYYTRTDERRRPCRVFRHTLGRDPAEDALVYEERDEAFSVEVSATKDRRFVCIAACSKATSEVLLIERVGAAPRALFSRRAGVQYFVEHRAGRLLVLTNALGGSVDAEFELADAPLPAFDAPVSSSVPLPLRAIAEVRCEAGAFLEDIDVFDGHVVLYERAQALPRLRVWAPGGAPWAVPLPVDVAALHPGGNLDFASPTFHFTLSSPIHVESALECDVRSRQVRELRGMCLSGAPHDPGVFECSVLRVPTSDGAVVPVTVARRRDVALDGRARCLIEAYGAYGRCLDADFQPGHLALLQRGWVVALAHVRGGGELGRAWHAAGRGPNKARSVLDLIEARDHLVETGYTAPARVGAVGTSAGGLLLAAALNRRPDLFQGAVLNVPFVDVLRSMADPSLPLTIVEYEEWGNPNDPTQRDAIAAVDPYLGLDDEKRYPHLLVTASEHDVRCPPAGALRYVAKLRHHRRNMTGKITCLKVHEDSGHAGEGGRFGDLREKATFYSFLDVSFEQIKKKYSK